MVKKNIPEPIKRIAQKLLFPLPRRLSQNHIHVDDDGLQSIRESIKKNYHVGWRSESHYSPEAFEQDLADHLHQRLDSQRRTIVPWLDGARRLRDARILEIGCGTGSSTIALTEQGVHVTGIDIDEGALVVAKDRCKLYGVEAQLEVRGADAISEAYGPNAFDWIIFFASLEHMTITERLISLKAAWELLPAGGLLVVVQTPNRLWYFDSHTSWLPFFHWLPDELAFQYSRFSPRENFRDLYTQYDEASREHFLRRGRGLSFHEFELAIKPAKELKVVSSLSTFQGIRYKLQQPRLARRYKSMLRRIYPGIHQGFFDEVLFLIVEKE